MAAGAKQRVAPASLIRTTEAVSTFPGLDRIGDRLAKGLASAIQGLASSVEVTRGAVDVVRHGDWQAGFDLPVATIRYRLGAANGWALLVVGKQLVSRLVDCFYGGAGASMAGDAFTPAEERFLARLARTLQPALGAAWADHVGDPTLDRCELGLPAAAGAAAVAEIAVQPFALAGAATGTATVHVAYPLAMLRVMPSLAAPADTGDPPAASPVWRRRLSDAVMQARLPVRTIFAQPEIPLADLLRLQRGDIIPVCLPARLPVTVAGRLFARASLGESNGRASVRIETIEQKGPGHE